MAAPCITGFLTSGWNITDFSTLKLVTDEKTIQRFPPTGSWIGTDAIVEYLSAYGSDVAHELVDLTPKVFDFSRSMAEECAFWSAGVTRVETKVPFTNVPMCIDFSVVNFFKYNIFPDAISPEEPTMLITEWDILTDPFLGTALFGALDTPVTAEYTCEAILACEDDADNEEEETPNSTRRERRGLKGKKEKEGSKKKKGKSKGGKKSGKKEEDQEEMAVLDRMTECIEKLAALPLTAEDGYHLDGNSRACRMLHGGYARTNKEQHCPHVSFEKEMDVNGLFKCYESSLVTNQDRYTEEQMDFFYSIPLPYDAPNPYLNVGPCDELPPVPEF